MASVRQAEGPIRPAHGDALWKRHGRLRVRPGASSRSSRGREPWCAVPGDGPRFDRGGPLGRANHLVDGFDSRPACPAQPIPDARLTIDLLCRKDQVEQRARRACRVTVDPALRTDRDAMAAAAAGSRPAASGPLSGGDRSTPFSRFRHGRSSSCGAAKSISLGEPAGGSPVVRPRPSRHFSLADPENEGSRRARPGRLDRQPHETCSPGVRSSTASGIITSAAASSTRPTTSAATARGHASRAARLAGRRAPRSGRLAQGAAPADRHAAPSTGRRRKTTRPRQAIDADNRLLWRMNRRRLEAEAIRDSVLAVSGTLDSTDGRARLRALPLQGRSLADLRSYRPGEDR